MEKLSKAELLSLMMPHRDKWDVSFRPDPLDVVGEGEESVWDYPRPPCVEAAYGAVRVAYGETIIAQSETALDVKETAGAPVPYIAPDDVQMKLLRKNDTISHCEWKGEAHYYDVILPDGNVIKDAAWSYHDPFDDLNNAYLKITDYIAFYPYKFDCYIQDRDSNWEKVRPQPGNIYGGWVTNRIKGPIKGGGGTAHW